MPYTREQLNMTFRRISSGGIASLPRKLLRRKMLQITKDSGNISAGRKPGFLVFPILTKKDSARGAKPFVPDAPFNLRSRRLSMKTFALLSGLALLVVLAMPTHVAAQATISTGSIQGTILDPKGGVVPD